MSNIEDLLVQRIEERAWHRAGSLAGDLVRAASREKEPILAELEFERWLAESCAECDPER